MGDISEAFRRARLESEDPSELSEVLRPAETGPRIFPRGKGAQPVATRPEVEPARISAARTGDWPTRAVWVQQHGPVAESFRHLALQVRKELAARSASSVLVVSCGGGEGKTLTACNLALALASLSAGERIALVELDVRRPGLAESLGVAVEVGFESVLRGDASLDACRIPTDVPGLDLYPVRRPLPHPHEWLGRPSVAASLRELEESYATVVCDGPPGLPVPDVELLAPHLGACLAVVRAGKTPRSGYIELVEMLPKEKLIGAFLNWARPPRYARRGYRYDDYDSPAEGS